VHPSRRYRGAHADTQTEGQRVRRWDRVPLSDSESASGLFTVTMHSLRARKCEAVPVPGRETSRLPHFLDNRLTDGGKVVSLTRRPPFTPQEDSWYSFLLEAESTPGS
jgi:hypothetical protein